MDFDSKVEQARERMFEARELAVKSQREFEDASLNYARTWRECEEAKENL